MASAIDHPRKKARKNSRWMGHVSICNDINCDVIAHLCCPVESVMNRLPLFKGLPCFIIAHYEHCKDTFVEIERKVQKKTRHLRKNPTHEEIANL